MRVRSKAFMKKAPAGNRLRHVADIAFRGFNQSRAVHEGRFNCTCDTVPAGWQGSALAAPAGWRSRRQAGEGFGAQPQVPAMGLIAR